MDENLVCLFVCFPSVSVIYLKPGGFDECCFRINQWSCSSYFM